MPGDRGAGVREQRAQLRAGTTTTGASRDSVSLATTHSRPRPRRRARTRLRVVGRRASRRISVPGSHSRESISTLVISRLLGRDVERDVIEDVAELHQVTSEEMLARWPVEGLLDRAVGGNAVVVQRVGHDLLEDRRGDRAPEDVILGSLNDDDHRQHGVVRRGEADEARVVVVGRVGPCPGRGWWPCRSCRRRCSPG